MALTDEKMSELFAKYKNKKGFLIPLLQEIQNEENYLSKESIQKVAEKFNVKIAEIYGVATFYSSFRLKPIGDHVIRVCKGTACHVSGADSILNSIKNILNLEKEEETTADNFFTVVEVACLGCCSLAPAIMIDDKTYGNLNTEKLGKIIQAFRLEFDK